MAFLVDTADHNTRCIFRHDQTFRGYKIRIVRCSWNYWI